MVDIEDTSEGPESVVLKFLDEVSEDSSGLEDESDTEAQTTCISTTAVSLTPPFPLTPDKVAAVGILLRYGIRTKRSHDEH